MSAHEIVGMIRFESIAAIEAECGVRFAFDADGVTVRLASGRLERWRRVAAMPPPSQERICLRGEWYVREGA